MPSNIEMAIIITDTIFKYEEKALIEILIKQNQVVENNKINLIKIHETRRNNRLIYNAKLKINSQFYRKEIPAQKSNVGWEKC